MAEKRDEYLFGRRESAILQLFLMVLSIFAFSYVMEQTTAPDENLLFPLISSYIQFVSQPLFPLASAAVRGCCSETSGGAYCSLTEASDCVGSFAPGADCSSTTYCQKGCCYNDSVGIYESAVLQRLCDADWVQDPNCNLPGATLGCCVIGSSTSFLTEGQCRVESEIFGYGEGEDYDWQTGMDEVQCILLAGEQKVGACVMNNQDCDFITEADCVTLNGEFHEDLLCTATELNTTCEKSERTTCVDGRDGVYFVDTCGNVGNIYDAGRYDDATYWRNYYKPQDSCSAPNGAQGSKTCGNCDRFDGGICAPAKPDDFEPVMGDYYCKNTACTYRDFWGQVHHYKNGEAWCVYDSTIDNGDDAPGSRHFRFICNAGVVKVEPCADYRNEICIQQDTINANAAGITGDVNFYNAYCRKNNAKHCLEIGERSVEACNDEPDCMVESVNVGGSFDFDICVPKYPEGFSFDPQYQATGSQVCAINTRTCVVTYQPVLFGCVCIDNCGCLNRGSFNNQMDRVCTALGDCKGVAYVKNYKEDNPQKGAYAKYDTRIEKYMLAAGLGPGDYLGIGSGLFEQSAFSGALFASKLDSSKQAPTPKEDNSAAMIGGILTALGGLLASLGGILGSTMMMIAGMALSLMGAIMSLIGAAQCPPTFVDYNCNLYQPPTGGGDCDYCNNEKDVPCTQYRCNTLGAACEYINEGTEDALCIAAGDDGGFPVIEHILTMDEIIENNELYDFPELLEFIQDTQYQLIGSNTVKITNGNGGCVDAYNPVPISFNTNEPAYCKFDIEWEGEGYKDFEDMEFDVGLNTYKFNHSTFFQMPDPSHGVAECFNVTKPLPTEMKLYVKCQDRYGHKMPEYMTFEACVNDGPDETPPRIVATSPKKGDYVSYDSDGFNLRLITNELAECRWDYETSKTFDEMQHNFVCNDSCMTPSTTMGYVCNGDMPVNRTEGSTEMAFYVKCKDQPWLADSSERNADVESIEFKFYRPDGKIKIDSIKPEGEIATLATAETVTLEVRTSGGALNHTCMYSMTDYKVMNEMFETGSPGLHMQELVLPSDKYTVYVECIDETGDTVRSESSVRILKKSGSTLVSRAWQSSSNLYFSTVDEADCRSSGDTCFFDFEAGEPLTGDGYVHRIYAQKGKVYFVKCKDSMDTVPTGCTIVLAAV